MTPEQRAAQVYPPPVRPLSDEPDHDCLRGIADAIRAASVEVRERCALEVERQSALLSSMFPDNLRHEPLCRDLARAIRNQVQI